MFRAMTRWMSRWRWGSHARPLGLASAVKSGAELESGEAAVGGRMRKPAFIITVDVEEDDVWTWQPEVTTHNALFLPRFQKLCEKYGLRATYLVNYEMIEDRNCQAFVRDVTRRGVGEIESHIHPWNSPPFDERGKLRDHVYMYELPTEAIHEKLELLTRRVADVVEQVPISHRAGRWGLDERVVRVLVDLGYLVDCSVTPGVSWRRYKGAGNGNGGPDYWGFPERPYFVDPSDICRSGTSPLLEVPVTVKPNYSSRLQRFHHVIEDSLPGKVLRRLVGPPFSRLSPDWKSVDALLKIVAWAFDKELPVVELALHSSELMPGGSPTFRTREHVESLYETLQVLFRHMARLGVVSMTLAEYRLGWCDK